MRQPTDTHRTTKDLSPAELAQYRRRLNQQLQNRQVDEALLQRAWDTAHRIAAMLYEDFDATQVGVFGSLAQQHWFSKRSDIDIAVWGLSSEMYFRAIAETTEFSREFKIDLVNFENCKDLFRERIQSQAVLIQKSTIGPHKNSQAIVKGKGTNTLVHEELIQRISDGYTKVKGSVQLIDQALQNIKDAPERYKRSIEIEIARYLYDFYKQLENIFERIASEIDKEVPTDEKWHKNLLLQMAEPRTIRAPVISQKTYLKLQELLGFRHVFIYIYGGELDYEKMLENAKRIKEMFSNLSEELEVFITFLKQQEND